MLPAAPSRSNENLSAASPPAKLLLLSADEPSSAAIAKSLISPDFLLRRIATITDVYEALRLDPTIDALLLDTVHQPDMLSAWMNGFSSRNAGFAQPSILLLTDAAHLP
ncbi:MAG: hypothetical protein H0U76_05335, partial [Ktedonobacteraceae bacterium]|nr:hypothetical protein [Ktedonobacteraceae bacterium]